MCKLDKWWNIYLYLYLFPFKNEASSFVFDWQEQKENKQTNKQTYHADNKNRRDEGPNKVVGEGNPAATKK